MATRSTLSIACGSAFSCDLYRHWDGSPDQAGKDLARLLGKPEGSPRPRGAEAALLAERALAESYPPRHEFDKPRPVYEVTGRASSHTDRQWSYSVDFPSGGPVVVTVRYHDLSEEGIEGSVEFSGSVAQYRVWIAREIRAHRRRWLQVLRERGERIAKKKAETA